MAKKSKDTIYEEFLADLKTLNPGIEEVLKDEKVSAKLREGVMARADYSQSKDELRAQQEQFAAEVEQARQKIEGWQKWYGETSTQVATMHEKLNQYETLYGEIEDSGDKRRAARALGISKEDVDSLLETKMNQRDLAALKFADDLTDIKLDYMTRFKEKLDTQEVFKIAGERGTDLNTAYNLHIAERIEEVRNKDFEERIKKERAEAVSEYASQHNLPVVPNTSDMVHVLDAKDVPNTPRERTAAALAAFNTRRNQ